MILLLRFAPKVGQERSDDTFLRKVTKAVNRRWTGLHKCQHWYHGSRGYIPINHGQHEANFGHLLQIKPSQSP
jgi:hypothetical protein